MAPQETLKLFVDVLSPFSFLAYTTVRRYQQLWNVDLQVKPVLLAGLMAG
jgi:glutathione S-transferase kappa 1